MCIVLLKIFFFSFFFPLIYEKSDMDMNFIGFEIVECKRM